MVKFKDWEEFVWFVDNYRNFSCLNCTYGGKQGKPSQFLFCMRTVAMVDFKFMSLCAEWKSKNGKSLEKKEYHYYKEDHFGIHYIQKESGSATNYIDYYKITDATGDEIRFADYDYNNQKDKVAYVSKDIKEDDTCLPSDISNKYKNGVSLIEDYAYDYNDVTKTFTLYQEHIKYYGVGEDDIKIVVSYKEKDIPTTGEYNLKTEITAVYKDEKISSYKEVITTTSGEKSIKEFSVKYTKPDIKLPKNWKDFKKDYVVER